MNSTECISSITLLCIRFMDLIWLISNWVASLLALTGQRVQFVYKTELSLEVNFLKRLIFFSNRSLGSLYVLKCNVVYRYMLIYNFLMRKKKCKKKINRPLIQYTLKIYCRPNVMSDFDSAYVCSGFEKFVSVKEGIYLFLLLFLHLKTVIWIFWHHVQYLKYNLGL